LLLLGSLFACSPGYSGPTEGSAQHNRNGKVEVEVKTTLSALIRDEDTDGDTRITIDDPHSIT